MIIEKAEDQYPLPEKQPTVYNIKYTKEVTTLEGKKVEVIDDQRTEQVTVAQLEAQKVNYQNAIKTIDEKLDTISKL